MWCLSVSEGATPGARGFLLCVVTEESKSRVSCKICTFSCKRCTHHSIINMKINISCYVFM